MSYYDEAAPVYRRFRKEEPSWVAAIARALGDATTVVNVGAGTGNYEPRDRIVTAVEPSMSMLAARPRDAAPAVRAEAENLPFGDGAFDASLAILTLHHWRDTDKGLAELRRVARHRAVILTWHPGRTFDHHWLVQEYLPVLAQFDTDRFPTTEHVVEAMGGHAEVEVLPVPHDCPDGFLGAYWRRPEMYLDAGARGAMSVFADLPASAIEPGLKRLREDLNSGAWHERHRDLLAETEVDLGFRLIVARDPVGARAP